ncbi:MAG: ATP-grasp domain-containing protein [Candidatus Omnitrophica bacterium]|nr:ATP-grasp domain-containing protein [Candidatus Omnitrophota bacterium]
MKKKLNVLMLFYSPYQQPRGYDYREEFSDPDNMYTERDVLQALKELGHEVRLLGIYNDISPLFEEIKENPCDVIFNMMEVFDDQTHLEKNLAALLEILGIPFTGASSGVLYLCNNKALHKKIFNYHRVKVPRFYDFPKGSRVFLPAAFQLPAMIKPLCEEASRGISQASIVDTPEAFMERVKFIHQNMGMDAIAEEFIKGRELYVTVMGNKPMTVFPPREMVFKKMSEDQPHIATYKAKWDDKYRKRWGIDSVPAKNLDKEMIKKINDLCKRAYQALDARSYLRFDLRLTPEGEVYIIEPNANPCIARIDEMAQAAQLAGVDYPELIQRVLEQALHLNAQARLKKKAKS